MNVNERDKLTIEYVDNDGRTVNRTEDVTLKTIKYYNEDLYIVTFEEKQGNYIFSEYQLIHFKNDNK